MILIKLIVKVFGDVRIKMGLEDCVKLADYKYRKQVYLIKCEAFWPVRLTGSLSQQKLSS